MTSREESKSLSLLASSIIERYGDKASFMKVFSYENQMLYGAYPNRCVNGNAPTLGAINTTYGKNTAVQWLMTQIFDLSEYCGCKGKLSVEKVEMCARAIESRFHWLKVTEIMLFFYNFKMGDYGEFFGAVDPTKILASIKIFLNDRALIIEAEEKRKMEIEREEARKNAITYDEYIKRKTNQNN